MILKSNPGLKRLCLMLSALLCAALTACGEPPKPVIEFRYLSDLPDEQLVKDCDTSERDPANNGALSDELILTREQRDTCAGQVKGIKTWWAQAVERAKAQPKP